MNRFSHQAEHDGLTPDLNTRNGTDEIVVPIPVELLPGMAVGYYLTGFAVTLRQFRVHDDNSLIDDLFFASIGGILWLPLVLSGLDELEEQLDESDSGEDSAEKSGEDGG